MDYLQILHNKQMQKVLNKRLDVNIDYERIKWIAQIFKVEVALFIFSTYLKECYNISTAELVQALTDKTPIEE